MNAHFGDKQGLENKHIDGGGGVIRCLHPAIGRPLTASNERYDMETENFVAHTLRGTGFDASEDGTGRGTPLAVYRTNGKGEVFEADKAMAITGMTDQNAQILKNEHGVRRYCPMECERLQGLPDGFTARGKDDAGKEFDLADGPRYMMIGNAVTVNVGDWLGRGVPLTLPSSSAKTSAAD